MRMVLSTFNYILVNKDLVETGARNVMVLGNLLSKYKVFITILLMKWGNHFPM